MCTSCLECFIDVRGRLGGRRVREAQSSRAECICAQSQLSSESAKHLKLRLQPRNLSSLHSQKKGGREGNQTLAHEATAERAHAVHPRVIPESSRPRHIPAAFAGLGLLRAIAACKNCGGRFKRKKSNITAEGLHQPPLQKLTLTVKGKIHLFLTRREFDARVNFLFASSSVT